MKNICQVCKNDHDVIDRYPNAICNICRKTYKCMNSLDEDAKPIEFCNVDECGGFQALVDGKVVETNICYVNGIKCLASESRFGGIVISVCY